MFSPRSKNIDQSRFVQIRDLHLLSLWHSLSFLFFLLFFACVSRNRSIPHLSFVLF